MSLRNFSTRLFQDDIEMQMHRLTLQDNSVAPDVDFYDSDQAKQMASELLSQQVDSENSVCIEKNDLCKIIESLKILRRFYRQKIVPYSTILRLDELIKRLEDKK